MEVSLILYPQLPYLEVVRRDCHSRRWGIRVPQLDCPVAWSPGAAEHSAKYTTAEPDEHAAISPSPAQDANIVGW